VDTDDDVRLARRIQRDVQQRGRDVAGVIEQYTRVSGAGAGCGLLASPGFCLRMVLLLIVVVVVVVVVARVAARGSPNSACGGAWPRLACLLRCWQRAAFPKLARTFGPATALGLAKQAAFF
jgi:hypothetical protein